MLILVTDRLHWLFIMLGFSLWMGRGRLPLLNATLVAGFIGCRNF